MTTMPRPKSKNRFRNFVLLVLGALLLACIALTIAYQKADKTPSELMRYVEHRLDGHPKLESLAQPFITMLRHQVERPIVTSGLPALGKGALSDTLPPQQYAKDESPLPVDPSLRASTPADISAPFYVRNEFELRQAMAQARPGQSIVLTPGTYPVAGPLQTGTAGTAAQPITVRAQRPGTVTVEFNTTEGFQIAHAFWIFENLTIRGVCPSDEQCEHAFHVYGAAKSVVIRNNQIIDFNAHLKVNGLRNNWPDNGLAQHNTFTNTHRRATQLPVTYIDIVGANRWVIADNIISNFSKSDGNQVAYGVFMKGASQYGRIERNLVVCSEHDISQTGVRVGISIGGGGTGHEFCRDKRCDTEHSHGVVANNIVAHCNDFGIDVNRSNQTLIAHNTLINTSGIDVRQSISSAVIEGNLLEGRIRSRDGALIDSQKNVLGHMRSYFNDPDHLDLKFLSPAPEVGSAQDIKNDFCQRPRAANSFAGALAMADNCMMQGALPLPSPPPRQDAR
ncbi:MAG TPA: right-handed parallel beta-helix repeat-containing protein [Rhodocyclaceae bacterium]|nr:right-handed parallel beta-helix repeat-containing protein [Rhodocyclaceae bacterium]